MSSYMIVKSTIVVLIIAAVTLCLIFFKKKRVEITVLIISTVIALIIGEFSLRIFLPQMEEYSNMFAYDSLLGWRFVTSSTGRMVLTPGGPGPNTVKTNSLGFRDHEPSKSKTHRIMVLGDSFVSNVSVKDDEVFTEIMEAQLQDSDVQNFGVNAYGEVQEYLLLKKWVNVIHPDLIILVVYLENDFADNVRGYWHYSRPYASLEGMDSTLTFHPQSIQPPKEPSHILSRSHLNRLLSRAMNRLFMESDSTIIPPEFYTCQSPMSIESKLQLRILEKLLVEIATLSQEQDIPIVFALAPSMLQVRDDLWQEFTTKIKTPNGTFLRSLPDDELMHFAASNNLVMMDLLPILIEANRKQTNLYHPIEVHWTKEGNRIVANALLDYLKAKSLIEAN